MYDVHYVEYKTSHYRKDLVVMMRIIIILYHKDGIIVGSSNVYDDMHMRNHEDKNYCSMV